MIAVSPGTPSGLAWDGEPLELWGIRAASGAARESWSYSLVEQLPIYRRHGVNALTVFYQGSSGGSRLAFSPDGREIDGDVRLAIERIVRAAQGMVVVAGIFYHGQAWRLDPERGPWLADADAYRRAAEAVARHLKGFDNVVVNVVNEFNSAAWAGCPFPAGTVDGVVELCRTVKAADPDRLVGGGGIHRGPADEGNTWLARRPELDVLLFDWHGPSEPAVGQYRQAGSDKPLINVELFGGWAQGFVEEDAGPERGQAPAWPGWGRDTPRAAPPGRRRIQGVFPPGGLEGTHRGRQDFLAEVAYAARTPGFSLFGHFPGWLQGPSRDPAFDCRFDLGGQGTRDDPGLRWYFQAVAQARGHPPDGTATGGPG
jgi:hypothetical protein